MILTNPFADHQTPRFDVETLIRRHGVMAVLRALASALITGSHNRLPHVDALPNHLRRDIGLETRHEKPLPPGLVR